MVVFGSDPKVVFGSDPGTCEKNNLPTDKAAQKHQFYIQYCTRWIHGAGILTSIYHKHQLNVGKYTSPMDLMG